MTLFVTLTALTTLPRYGMVPGTFDLVTFSSVVFGTVLSLAAAFTVNQHGQNRRAEETEEQRNSRLSTMAQCGQERRVEETEEQRNSLLSVMVQHTRERCLNVIEGQNHYQIQTFYAARTVLYPIVEEHNCGEMDNLCLKCGGLYFQDEKNTKGIYTH
ncbi:hypothetical protein AVEN_259333-1 [Araneus ventricosus]|uniref:STPR domain-containing protein n=1 Tax=Araneus ventricosus TaxID=182803 RepID=A0A4Y2JI42_ARAVE|nr:hypothetical protein AVEN_259333-1 [Araneus ventricosus]